MTDTDGSVPLWWIVFFLVLALGGAIGASNFVGGSIVFLLPVA